MFKRKKPNRKPPKRPKIKLLRKLTKPEQPDFVYVSRNPGSTAWAIKVKAEHRDLTNLSQADKKAIAHSFLEVAVELQLQETEQELASLKGDRTKKATARRKELKTKIDQLHRYRNHLHALPPGWSTNLYSD